MKEYSDIEKFLTSGSEVMLDPHEKAALKARILSRVGDSRFRPRRPLVSPFSSWLMRGTASFASLVLVCVGTAYAAQRSLPGDPLYSMKVNVVEDMIGLTKIDTNDRVAYNLSLMERRLAELKTLSVAQDAPLPEDLVAMGDQIEEHSREVHEDVAHASEADLTHTEKLETLTRLGGISQAQGRIAQDKNFDEITDTITHTSDTNEEALADAVTEFTSEAEESASEYLSTQIDVVHDRIVASSTEVHTRNEAEHHLLDVDEALSDGDTTSALVSVLRAQETITADAYGESDVSHVEGQDDIHTTED